MIKEAEQYRDAGLRVFDLHGVRGGVCECGNRACKALYKHPASSTWQHTPVWTDEQWEVAREYFYNSGFGVLCNGLLVVDIDPRNGGQRIPELEASCGFVVQTGGGGWHYYFSAGDSPLAAHHEEFPGVDFKSTGFVVGAGSNHASGNHYKIIKGEPSAIVPAPPALLEKLKKSEAKHHAGGGGGDALKQELAEIVMAIPNDDCEYDDWISIGMGIHNSTEGSKEGFSLWETWSGQSAKHDPRDMPYKWRSFGKAPNPITIGTLLHRAEQAGYQRSVTFDAPEDPEEPAPAQAAAPSIDLSNPPGLVGEIAAWINEQCMYPRGSLAVAAALSAVGNIAGLRTVDDLTGVTANTFFLGIAGSGTGKGDIQKSYERILRAAGVGRALYTAVKSAQEVIRNALDHQLSIYSIDEIGDFLGRATGAEQSYLRAIVPLWMEIWSKADSFLPVSGDMTRAIFKELAAEIKSLERKIADNENTDENERILAEKKIALDALSEGLPRPFLSLMGFTTPQKFEMFMSSDTIQGGFVGRCLIVQESETNPRRNKRFNRCDVPLNLDRRIKTLFSPGAYDSKKTRLQHVGEPEKIQTTPEAKEKLKEVEEYFWKNSEMQKEVTGFEAIPRRGAEQTQKISLILAAETGVRTEQDIAWAFEFVKRDIELKINLSMGHDDASTKDEQLLSKILTMLDTNTPIAEGVIVNRCRKWKKEAVLNGLKHLASRRKVLIQEQIKQKRSEPTRFYVLTDSNQ